MSSYLEEEMDRQVLLYAVQRAIMCNTCGKVLDVKDSSLLMNEGFILVRHTACLPECFEPSEGTEWYTYEGRRA